MPTATGTLSPLNRTGIMTSVNDTTTRLAQLSAERGDILSELTAEARQAGAGA